MAAKMPSKPGEDAFDSLDWDPDLPSAVSPDKSPEPVPIKPQPVAYTTVGSVVNPNLIPQFAAPNRIQREGANRRPLMSILQGLQQDPTRRGPPPPLNLSNSMHYAQQFATRSSNIENQSSFTQNQAPFAQNQSPYSRSSRATTTMAIMQEQEEDTMKHQVMQMLSQQEKEILVMQYGTYPSQQHPSGYSTAPSTPSPIKRSKLAEFSKHQAFSIKELIEEDARYRSNNSQGIQGLEKMQTLQRLAKFDNPVQQFARSRLSEFSVAKSQMASTNPLGAATRDTIHGLDSGELNHDYQFPPPGMTNSSAPQSNPLLGAANRAMGSTPAPSRVPPGYPQPLTAGPPGQRQFPSLSIQSSQQGSWEGSEWYNPLGTSQTTNPWGYAHNAPLEQVAAPFEAVPHARLDYHDLYVSVKVVDTLPPAEVEKYFPVGWPSTVSGHWTPLPDKIQTQMLEAGIPPTSEERTARVEKMRNDFFHYGQRRMWGMSPDDYMDEMAVRQHACENGFSPIGPPRKRFAEPVMPKKVTIGEMSKMSLGEASVPLLNAAFGTLLALHDRGPDSSSNLSGFGETDPRLIDPEPKGNNTLFGEDWGRPTKPQSRTSRVFGGL